MKKPNYKRELRLKLKRERKRFKRKGKIYDPDSPRSREIKLLESIDRMVIANYRPELLKFFTANDFFEPNLVRRKIAIPDKFSFCDDYEKAIKPIKEIISFVLGNLGKKFEINFESCTHADQAALFVLKIVLLELQTMFSKLNRRLRALNSVITFDIKKSKSEEVNKLLFITGHISEVNLMVKGLMPLNTLGYMKGTRAQRHFSENSKGIIVTRVVNYLNNCLFQHGHEFSADGRNDTEGLISEILGNAEDHSPFKEYYLLANFMKESTEGLDDDVVGEVYLNFLNFGYSISEGFEKTKEQNTNMYEGMERQYGLVRNKIGNRLSKENLFTLYALQQGISRLKFEDASRGTGTIKFIESFFAFGDFQDPTKNYNPLLTIVSGCTEVLCDNMFRPVRKNGVSIISLNSTNSLDDPPEESHLKNLQSPFPGTLLSVKVYLNKTHITKKLNANR